MATWTIGHLEKVRALAGNGPLLAVGGVRSGKKSQITLFDAASKKTLRPIDVPSHVLSPGCSGNLLLAGCKAGYLRSHDRGPAPPGQGPPPRPEEQPDGGMGRRAARHQGLHLPAEFVAHLAPQGERQDAVHWHIPRHRLARRTLGLDIHRAAHQISG